MPKYIVRLDQLTFEWFRIEEEKEDFINSYQDYSIALDYCDKHNCTCREIAGDDPNCIVHGR